MEEIFSYGREGIRKFFRKNIVAILYTVIFHLLVLIVLVFVRIEGLKNDRELGIELEFEEMTLEQILAEEEPEIPPEWLEEVMRLRERSSNRAVNVNAEERFMDEISTSAYLQDLLEQIEEARAREDREKLEELQAILAAADYVPPEELESVAEEQDYTGPTTITYEFLEEPRQRGKVSLTIPVYRCQGSGMVRVTVEVSREGYVLDAEIVEPIEGTDRVCFADAALAAALSSRFRIESNGPDRHRAIISYTFISQ